MRRCVVSSAEEGEGVAEELLEYWAWGGSGEGESGLDGVPVDVAVVGAVVVEIEVAAEQGGKVDDDVDGGPVVLPGA